MSLGYALLREVSRKTTSVRSRDFLACNIAL